MTEPSEADLYFGTHPYVSYRRHARAYWRAHSGQRCGQAHFNALYEVDPDLADQVRATTVDPYYLDDRLDDFFDYLKATLEPTDVSRET